MSLRRRQELVQIAREFDACIITDDVYDMLQWPAGMADSQSVIAHAHLPRIVDIDRSLDGGTERQGADGFGNAVSNGSFSKISGNPSNHLNYWLHSLHAKVRAVERDGQKAQRSLHGGFRKCRFHHNTRIQKSIDGGSRGSSGSGGAPSQLTATFMSKLLESGDLQQHIFHTLQPCYARRYRRMISAIEQYLLPLGVELPQTSRKVIGGYFIWLTLPTPLDAEEVATYAKRDENLVVAPGSIFGVYGDAKAVDLRRKVRVCFSWEEEDKLAEGIQRLGQGIADIQRNMSQTNSSAVHDSGNKSSFLVE